MVVKVRDLFRKMAEEGRVSVLAGEEREITGITADSRLVKAGNLFAALPGTRSDGHLFLSDAAAAGAAALLVERGRQRPAGGLPGTAVIEAGNVRDVFGEAADRYYKHPSGSLDLIAVTGTNGKTSVTYLLESIFRAAGRSVGVIGTVEYRWGGKRRSAPCTTPEAHELQRILRHMADDGVTAVAMEVSSHALSQHRIAGCDIRSAIFTNLSRDHLDFHSDLEEYFLAKSRLFREYRPEVAIVNADDPWGEKMLARIPGRVISFGRGEDADCRLLEARSDTSGLRMTIRLASTRVELQSPLLGAHNIYNIMAAAAAALDCGIDAESIRAGIRRAGTIPGRFERASKENEPLVLVDYAHTPDALENALRAARTLARGSLTVVFGCGGDRDRGKRPLMGAAAARGADRTILTSDNPRSEDPLGILREIEEGYRSASSGGPAATVIPDRRRAIREAVFSARAGDVVLVAGKGHEDYQIRAGVTVPFSDRDVARQALEERKGE